MERGLPRTRSKLIEKRRIIGERERRGHEVPLLAFLLMLLLEPPYLQKKKKKKIKQTDLSLDFGLYIVYVRIEEHSKEQESYVRFGYMSWF